MKRRIVSQHVRPTNRVTNTFKRESLRACVDPSEQFVTSCFKSSACMQAKLSQTCCCPTRIAINLSACFLPASGGMKVSVPTSPAVSGMCSPSGSLTRANDRKHIIVGVTISENQSSVVQVLRQRFNKVPARHDLTCAYIHVSSRTPTVACTNGRVTGQAQLCKMATAWISKTSQCMVNGYIVWDLICCTDNTLFLPQGKQRMAQKTCA